VGMSTGCPAGAMPASVGLPMMVVLLCLSPCLKEELGSGDVVMCCTWLDLVPVKDAA